MTEQEERKKMAKEIKNALLLYEINIKENAEAIEKRFLELAIDPRCTFYEKTNRYRGAFDLVDAMYKCGVISRKLCAELERRINDNNLREIITGGN